MISGGVNAAYGLSSQTKRDPVGFDDAPWHAFRFHVEFVAEGLHDGASPSSADGAGASTPLVCQGAFSDVTGLEATMEPKAITEGGRNYGAHQRVGAVTFGTVILKRGMTSTRHLWEWFFQTVQPMASAGGPAWAQRLTVYVVLQDHRGQPLLRWRLRNALPTRFRAGDLSAKSSELVIEELQLVHEGLSIDPITA
jgi:phage tail-like protein